MKISKVPTLSYFGPSTDVGSNDVYTFAPDLPADDGRPFWAEFVRFLGGLPIEGHKWIISFLGSLAKDSLMPIVASASDPKYGCVYWLGDVHKPYPESVSNLTELSVLCELDAYARLLDDASVEMRYGFYVGGWLVPCELSENIVATRKFQNGRFTMRHPFCKASFFSSEDFNHLVVVPFDSSFAEALADAALDKAS